MHSQSIVELPQPTRTGETSVEQALAERSSVREFGDRVLTLTEVAQLLWSAQGISRPGGYRTAPSAGALFPLEVFLVSNRVSDLPPGAYRYLPYDHGLELMRSGDLLGELSVAALGQEMVAESAAALVIAAVFERTTGKYGDRGISYVHMEVGGAAENVHLQAESLRLGTVFVGAFEDDRVHAIIGARANERPLCILPVGEPLEAS